MQSLGFRRPEVHAVNVLVGKPDAKVMQVVGRRDLGDHVAARSKYRMDVGTELPLLDGRQVVAVDVDLLLMLEFADFVRWQGTG